jgi:hypothetical protein
MNVAAKATTVRFYKERLLRVLTHEDKSKPGAKL